MNWEVRFLPEAEKDFSELDDSQKLLVRKAIKKVSQNPLPQAEGGFGKPLGNRGNTNLTGFLKVKLRAAGLRIVYKLVRQEDHMLGIVIGARADDEVYQIAHRRREKHDL